MTAMSARCKSLAMVLEGLVPSRPEMDIAITDLTADSRAVRAGGCFVALAGTQHGATEFIDQAADNGAAVILTDTSVESSGTKVPLIGVPDIRAQLPTIARRFFDDPSSKLRLVAVTGTNGKTTVAHTLAQALAILGEKAAYIGTLGHGKPDQLVAAANTTPDTVALNRCLAHFVDDNIGMCTLEASSHGLAQGRLEGIRCEVVVFTNLSRDHLDYHGDLVTYQSAKEKVFALPGIRAAVVNIDDPVGQQFGTRYADKFDLWTCSVEGVSDQLSQARVSARSVECSLATTRFDLVVDGESASVKSAVPGRVNVQNLLHSAAVLLSFGHSLDQVANAIARVSLPPGRLQRCDLGDNRPMVFIDYAHTPDSLRAVLRSLRELCEGTVTTVFGCGGERDKGKRRSMGEIASQLSDRCVITNDNPRSEDPQQIVDDIVAGIECTRREIILDRRSAIERAILESGTGDVVLLAGKGHESFQVLGHKSIPFSDMAVARDVGMSLP